MGLDIAITKQKRKHVSTFAAKRRWLKEFLWYICGVYGFFFFRKVFVEMWRRLARTFFFVSSSSCSVGRKEERGGVGREQTPPTPLPFLGPTPLSPEVTEEKVWKQKRGREEEGKCGQSTKIQKWREGEGAKRGGKKKVCFSEGKMLGDREWGRRKDF